MEDAVESLVVEEESKKISVKSRFRRRRNKSSTANNNSSMERETQASTSSKDEEQSDHEHPCEAKVVEVVVNVVPNVNGTVRETSKNSSCLLLRLFESKLFDMSLAISYLFKSKESGVQAYLGNKLFSLNSADVDKYLPQIVNMYIHMEDVAEAIYHYFIERAKTDVEFAVQLSWLLEAHCADGWLPRKEHQRGLKVLNIILEENNKPKSPRLSCCTIPSTGPANGLTSTVGYPHKKASHQRSRSDATAAIVTSNVFQGDVMSQEAFCGK